MSKRSFFGLELSLLALILSTFAVVTTGCGGDDDDSSFEYKPFSIESNVLVTFKRENGAPAGDLTQAIEELYGFRAETVSFVVPTVGLDLLSEIQDTDPSHIVIDWKVQNWETHSKAVVNEAIALPVSFYVYGVPTCWYCESKLLESDLVKAYGAKADEVLEMNLELRILGKNLETGLNDVIVLSPSMVEYGCALDRTAIENDADGYKASYDLGSAAKCTGKVEFTL